jgi:hypothetical protein
LPRTKTSKRSIIREALGGKVDYAQQTKAQRLDQIKWRPDGSHLLNFGHIYFPKEFRSASPQFHYLFAERYYKHQLLVETWPRGFSKTTIEKIILRWNIVVYGRDDLCPKEHQSPVDLFISKTDKIASRIIGGIKRVMGRNRLLKQDFGDLFGGGKETESEIIFSNGHVLAGTGWGGSVRGFLTDDGDRVTTWIIDDLVDKALARSKDQLQQITEWILEEVMNLEGGVGEEAKGLITGNRMALHDHLGKLRDKAKEQRPGEEEIWHYEELSAVIERDEKGNIIASLWPERFPPKTLMRKERKMGKKGFKKELENKPVDEDDLTFSEEDLKRYSFPLSAVDEKWPGVLAYDTATRPGKKNDYTVILLGRQSPDKKIWICKGWRLRVKMTKGAKIYVDILQSEPNIRRGVIETIAAQIMLYDTVKNMCREEGIHVILRECDNSTRSKQNIPLNKNDRIETMAPGVESGDLAICEDIPWLIEMTAECPNGEFDDGPDCMQMVQAEFSTIKPKGTKQYSGTRAYGSDMMRGGGGSRRVA